MGVSKNRGTPKSSILIGFSIINHPFWGTPIFWKHPYVQSVHLPSSTWFTWKLPSFSSWGSRNLRFGNFQVKHGKSFRGQTVFFLFVRSIGFLCINQHQDIFSESSAVRPPVLHVFLFSWFPFFSGNLFIFLGNLKFKPGHAPKTKNQRILRNVWAKNFLYRHCFICCF